MSFDEYETKLVFEEELKNLLKEEFTIVSLQPKIW